MNHTIEKIRKILRSEYGNRNYRITSDGEIHIYGTMPQTNQIGWYLYGHVCDQETNRKLSEIA